MKSVSWSQVTKDIRGMWAIYWSINDPIKKEECKRAIWAITDTVIRMHGMIDEEIANKQ